MGDTFDGLKNLRHLDLSANRIRGHIPHGMGSLTNLRDLRLSNNLLTSTFPVSLISLSNLETLLLDSNGLSGPLPLLLGEMRSLVTMRYVTKKLCRPAFHFCLRNNQTLTANNRIHENDLKGIIPSFEDAIVLEEAQ